MPYNDFNVSIRNIANDFYSAYKRCIEGKNPHIDEYGRHVMEVVNVPAIVNAAFACELYLKLLIKSETRAPAPTACSGACARADAHRA